MAEWTKEREAEIRVKLKVVCGYCEHLKDEDCDSGEVKP